MRRLAQWIDLFQDGLGHSLSWLTAAMVAATVVVVALRYGAGIGAIALQESVIYMNSLVFLAGAAWTFKENRHVRVDILYSRLSRRAQVKIDLAGHLLFLLPMCIVVSVWSFDWVVASWRIREGSPEVGGIPAVFLLKTIILVMPTLLSLQIFSECVKLFGALKSNDSAS